jgi:hypothetical protein
MLRKLLTSGDSLGEGMVEGIFRLFLDDRSLSVKCLNLLHR